jgi:hypothetical protein
MSFIFSSREDVARTDFGFGNYKPICALLRWKSSARDLAPARRSTQRAFYGPLLIKTRLKTRSSDPLSPHASAVAFYLELQRRRCRDHLWSGNVLVTKFSKSVCKNRKSLVTRGCNRGRLTNVQPYRKRMPTSGIAQPHQIGRTSATPAK